MLYTSPSAGAAVISKLMIAGNPKARGGPPPLVPGLGLWPEAIVDQHFVVRGREPRLLAAVQMNPKLVGVGIDEATFVIVSGGGFEVGGQSVVLVLDARGGAEMKRRELKAGDKFEFGQR